jgi:putative ABC transport system substrate-binding protein
MKRRGALLALAALGGLPVLSRAQGPKRTYRIGYLIDQPLIEPPSRERAAFLQGLRELGYVDGANLRIEYRSSESDPAFLPELAADLAAMRVDAIVAMPNAPVHAAMKASRTIPIIFLVGDDPVRQGFAKSLARPGGNATGITLLQPTLEPKRLELLRELLPRARRVAMLRSPSATAFTGEYAQFTSAAARKLGLTLERHAIRDLGELPAQLDKIAASRPDALVAVADQRLIAARTIIAEFALARRLPSVMGVADYAQLGGLLSYATNIPEQFRRLASYVDRILKGAKPGELPVEQPTRFDLVVNLKTAAALGVTVPQPVLLRADRVIE